MILRRIWGFFVIFFAVSAASPPSAGTSARRRGRLGARAGASARAALRGDVTALPLPEPRVWQQQRPQDEARFQPPGGPRRLRRPGRPGGPRGLPGGPRRLLHPPRRLPGGPAGGWARGPGGGPGGPRRLQGRPEGDGGAASAPGCLHLPGPRGRPGHPEPGARGLRVRGEEGGRGGWGHQGGVPGLEPLPLQAGSRHPGGHRPDPHLPGRQGPLPGRRLGDNRVPRVRHRGAGGPGLRRRVLPPLGPRPPQRGQEKDQRDPRHRGRPAPPQVPHAHRHGGRHLRRRGAARPVAHRGPQRPQLPAQRRPLRHLHQGQLHRLDGGARGRVRVRGQEDAAGEHEAPGAAHAGALRARPRRGGGRLQAGTEAEVTPAPPPLPPDPSFWVEFWLLWVFCVRVVTFFIKIQGKKNGGSWWEGGSYPLGYLGGYPPGVFGGDYCP